VNSVQEVEMEMSKKHKKWKNLTAAANNTPVTTKTTGDKATGNTTSGYVYKPASEKPQAVLKFSLAAWEKLTYLRDKAKTEISGFGITDPEDCMYITDFYLPKQECTSATTEMDDEDIAEYFEDMLDAGYFPVNFMRIWIHTHPNMSTAPSGTDENTFSEKFGDCDWAIMFILGDDNKYSCALQYNREPKGRFQIKIEIDREFACEEWDKELEEKVSKKVYVNTTSRSNYGCNCYGYGAYDGYSNGFDWKEHNKKYGQKKTNVTNCTTAKKDVNNATKEILEKAVKETKSDSDSQAKTLEDVYDFADWDDLCDCIRDIEEK
jgi:proteasome lid subunit RPN8/RPN11